MNIPRRTLLALSTLASLIAAIPARAQEEGVGVQTHENAPAAHAVRLTGRIVLDGKLDDAGWATATPVTRFTQLDPKEGEPASQPIEVRIVYDAEAIYIGAYLHDDAPVSTRLVRRDSNAQDSDWFDVSLDTYHDHLSASSFSVNPSGVRKDQIGSGLQQGGGGGGGGSEWNPVWDVATAVTDSGWVAEMRIPLSQLRFGQADVQTWGLQLQRTIAAKHEQDIFSFTHKNERGGPPRYGHLTGLQGLKATKPLEVVPYLSGRADYRLVPQNAAVTFENPFRSGADYTAGYGADVQYRVSSNFTLNATINPDFGQTEVDPAVINLSAFETRLQENRSFFVEGADIFRFGGGDGGQILYSRRIGRAPQLGAPAGAAYTNLPDQATILGAAKLSGRTSKGWSIGLLEAVTSKEQAPYVDVAGLQREAVVEPLANYFTARLKRDFNQGNSTIGGILTSANRRLGDDPVMVSRLRTAAYAGGVDLRHEWARRVWSVMANLAPSYIQGSRDVIIAAQNSSARYYNRPDATYLQLDSAATSMRGYSGSVNVGKRAGAWTGSVGVNATSPGYEINDLGFQTTADRAVLSTQFNYRHNRPGRIFRNWGVGSGPDFSWNYGGNLVSASNGVVVNGQFANYWGGFFNFQQRYAALNDRLTRGGPLTRDLSGWSMSANVNSDQRKAYTLGGNLNAGRDAGGSHRTSVGANVGWKPAGNWDVRIGPDWTVNHTAAQYVQSVTDPLDVSTFGRRYVFAPLDQTTVSLETRLNVNFTPDMSLEIYAQPLISSGNYGSMKELQAPRTFKFTDYGVESGTIDPDGAGPAPAFSVANRDFNTHSLRGNAVFRWEWRPGSTLFLVWQQSRSETLNALAADPAFQQVGNFDIGRDGRELFGLRPDNVFMIKMTYWLNP
jgi:hypothetical protein